MKRIFPPTYAKPKPAYYYKPVYKNAGLWPLGGAMGFPGAGAVGLQLVGVRSGLRRVVRHSADKRVDLKGYKDKCLCQLVQLHTRTGTVT